jgi:hypothetical protein
MINSDQRSPNISREMLTGHPERRFGLGLPPTLGAGYQSNLQNASNILWKNCPLGAAFFSREFPQSCP